MPTFWKTDLAPLPKKTEKPEKVRKPIAPIGKRTKERISKHGTESEFFARIWSEKIPVCEICGALIPRPKPECFSHRLGKWRYPALRYEPKNITLVCGTGCHAENDRRNVGKDSEIIKEILG